MAKPRFYQPVPIKAHPGVKHKALDMRTDEYVGQGHDLVEAGVLKSEMLPARISWSWRPAGLHREAGGSVAWLPGYLTVIKVPERGYRVVLTVSREEQAARLEATKRMKAEQQAELERRRTEWKEQAPPHSSEMRTLKDADEFREMGLMYKKLMELFVTKGVEGFVVAADDREELLEVVGELQDLLRSARVVDTRKPKHLKLAWSA